MVYILVGVGLLLFYFLLEKKKPYNYLEEVDTFGQSVSNGKQEAAAINMAFLLEDRLFLRFKNWFGNTYNRLKPMAWMKIVLFITTLSFAGYLLSVYLLPVKSLWAILVVDIIGVFLGLSWLEARDKKSFEALFPDALNTITSVITSGGTIHYALEMTAKTLEKTALGAEFQNIAERLSVGDSAHNVFQQASKRFPYPQYKFFLVVINANMQRGGSLKDVMKRLNRLLANMRSLENKKQALTAEARASSAIVATIPFIFLVVLKFINPTDLNFLLTDPTGQTVLYYLVGSELLGIAIIVRLMRGVNL